MERKTTNIRIKEFCTFINLDNRSKGKQINPLTQRVISSLLCKQTTNILLLCSLLLTQIISYGQTAVTIPPFYNLTGAGGDNTIPLGNASNQCQWVLAPGAFNTNGTTGTPAPAGSITKVYFLMGTTANNTVVYNNFTIKLAQNVGTLTSWPAAAFNPGMTTVFTAPSFVITGAAPATWIMVPLTTPFRYDPTLSLVYEISSNSVNANQVRLTTIAGNSRTFGPTGGAATGFGGLQLHCGIDVANLAPNDAGVIGFDAPTAPTVGSNTVVARVRNFGNNVINSVDVNWSVDGVLQTPVTYNTAPIDTTGGAGSNTAAVTLGTFPFVANTLHRFKAWTSMPNSVADTILVNDSTAKIFRTPALSGSFTVGTTGDFVSITEAISVLNSVGISGPTTFQLIDTLYNAAKGEVFPLTFANVTGNSATNTITFKPAFGNNAVIAHNTGNIINFSGSRNIILDGRDSSNNNNRNLSVVNTSLTGTLVALQNDAIGNTIRNLNLRSANTATTAGSINILASTGFVGNDSNRIVNNYFGRSTTGNYAVGVFAQGTSAIVQNNNNTISGNEFNSFSFNGIQVNATNTGNGSFWNISNNSFYDTATTTLQTSTWSAINFVPGTTSGSVSNTISNNFIGGSAANAGGLAFSNNSNITRVAVQVTTSLGGANTIYGNVIRNWFLPITANTLAFTGIQLSGGVANIDSNTVDSFRSFNNAVFIGINSTPAANYNITRNQIKTITVYNISTTAAIRAITLSGGQIVNVSNNTIKGLRTNSTNTATTTAASIVGIGSSASSNTVTIANNNIGTPNEPLVNNHNGTANSVMVGIVATSGTNIIENNTIDGLYMDSLATSFTSTATGAVINGILVSAFLPGQIIRNNAVRHLYQRSAQVTQPTQINGICYASSGFTTVNNNTVYGLFTRSTNINTTTAAALNGIIFTSNGQALITNNYIDSLAIATVTPTSTQLNGIVVSGTSGNRVANNTIKTLYNAFTTSSPGITGIQYVSSVLNNECEGNTIFGLVNTHTANTGIIQGIRYLSSTTLLGNNSFCNNNFVHSFSSRSTTATTFTGIELFTSSFASFSNNLIRLGIDTAGNAFTGPFTINGINNNVTSTTFTNRFYHNTVYIGGTPTSGASATAAFRSTFAILAIQDIRNNIFVNLVQNTGGTGGNYAMNLGFTPTPQSIINYNILWAGAGIANNFIGGGPGNATSMLGTGGWRRLAGIDLNSAHANPGLIAPAAAAGSINLRPTSSNVGEGVGDNTLTLPINTDFGYNNRNTNTPVDIGAWSSASNTLSADSIAPIINYTALTNTASILNRTLTATIVEASSGVAAGIFIPKVYFNKNNGTFFATSGVLASGNYRNGNWAFTIDYSLLGGVIPTDIIRYYVIAQDSIGNYSSLPAYAVANNTDTVFNAPATPNQYTIANPIPLTVTVGPTGTYASLTGALGLFNAINNSLLQGNTTVLLEGGTTITELGSVGLNPWLEINAGVVGNFGYTLTIRPSNNTQVLMTGAVTATDGMIRLNGADRVRFVGFSTTGTPADTNLLIQNTATSQPALTMLNDASDNTISNVIFETNNTGTGVTNGGAVRISPTSLITGNDNIEIRNCHFRRVAGGSLPGILFAASGTTGVNRENENLLIENSYFYNFNFNAISIGSGTGNNYRIKNNIFFQDTVSIHTISPTVINFTPATLSNNDTISGNLIAGNNFGGIGEWFGPTSTILTFTGINVTAGAITGTFINNNRIANINWSNTASNNFTGIVVNNGGGVATITNNYIGDTLLADNIRHAGNGTTLGISCQTGSNSIINNNIIANITNRNNIAANTSVIVNGIRAWNQTAVLQINNNRIINLRDSSLNTSTSTSAAMMGINISSATTSIQVNNNFISGLTNLSRNVAASSQVLGIANTSGLPIITNNVVENLNSSSISTGSTTSATLIGIWSSSFNPGQTISNNTVRYLTYNNPSPASTQVIGIMQSSGSGHTINNNLVHNIKSNSTSSNTSTTSAIIGIMHNGSGSAININGNTVHSLECIGTFANNNIVGILYQGTTTVVTNFVTRNYVHSFKMATTGLGRMIGIQQNSGSFTRYANNMIRLGIDSSGALFTGPYDVYGFLNDVTGNFEYFHNSVYLGGAPTSGVGVTAAIRLNGTLIGTQLYDIRNNILVNNIANNGGSGKNFAIRLAALPVNPSNLVSNFNLLRANGAGRHIAGTNLVDYTTLTGIAGWLRGSGYDLQSGTTNDSLFLNSTGPAFDVNMRLLTDNPAEGAGDPSLASIITTDFDNNLRSTLTPFDIGANAGAFTLSADVFPPSISFTPATNQGNLIGPLVISNVNIRDNVGVPLVNFVSMPKIYFKKGIAGTYASSTAIAYTGNARNANFTFEIQYGLLGTINTSDTIFYYIIAEDSLAGNICSQKPYAIASNVNTVTNDPLNPDFYVFLPVIPANSLFEVGAGQTYTTLTGAGGLFEMLNGNTIGGSITAVITSNITEPGTFALNQIGEDGTGAGTYTVTIRPDSTATSARIISGNISAGMLRLNGTDRVKITGVPHQSVNTALNYLTLRNSSTSGPVVLFVNGATQCRLNNLTIETANNLAFNVVNAGGISFAGTTNSFGNSMDSITNCTIRNDQSQAFPNGIPGILISSFHSGLVLNSNNVVSNCNLLNASSVYLNVEAGSGNAWNVSGNSCYINLPVITFNPLPIRFNGGILSEGHTINNNIIGGTAANGGGTAWTSNVQAAWNQIQLNVGNNIASTLNGNRIVNMNFAQLASGTQWNGIIVTGGRTNITNNMIGDSTNLTSIQLAPPINHNAIAITAAVNVATNITGNRIVGFFLNSPGNAIAFNGITVAGGITTITNNIIGAATIANSIVCNGSSTVRGINITTPANVDPGIIISNNTIANMSGTGTQNTVSVGGILQNGSTVSVITGNRVYNLSTSSSNTSLNSAPAAFGISLAASTNFGPIIANNTVYNIGANNNTATLTHAMGIIVQSANSARLNNNRVYDIRNLSTATSINPMATASGIVVFGITNVVDIINNQITLGNAQTNNTQYNGIWQNTSGGFDINCYYNSVLITGNNAAGSLASYAFHRGANSASEVTSGTRLINNALLNSRTGGTAKNYAIANEISGIPTGSGWLSINYNMLASASANTIGLWGATDMNMSNWRLSSLRDANSWADLSANVNPNALFADVANGNLNVVTTVAQNWYLNGKGIAGSVSASINTDYAGNTRGTTLGIGTDIGATEFTSSAIPPAVTISGAPALNGTSTISFANRDLATINWGGVGTVPSSITGAYYSGTNPPVTLPSTRFLNAYLSLSATGGSAYNYTSSINYDPALLGTVVSENDLKGANYNGSFWSGYPSSTVNTTAKTISIPVITNAMGIFTGTDANALLPVQLIQFTANPVNTDVLLNWATASETNNKGFVIERSVNGEEFEYVNFVKGKGNSTNTSKYSYSDASALDKTSTLYYRLKQVDLDGAYTYSNIVKVSIFNTEPFAVTVFPNPFTDNFQMELVTPENGLAQVSISDITGKEIWKTTLNPLAGKNLFTMDNMGTLHGGIYFIKVSQGNSQSVSKIVQLK